MNNINLLLTFILLILLVFNILDINSELDGATWECQEYSQKDIIACKVLLQSIFYGMPGYPRTNTPTNFTDYTSCKEAKEIYANSKFKLISSQKIIVTINDTCIRSTLVKKYYGDDNK